MSQKQLLEKIDQLKGEIYSLKLTNRDLQLEIQQRCQNYMMEISCLKSLKKKENSFHNKSLQSSKILASSALLTSKVILNKSPCIVQTVSVLNGNNKTSHYQSAKKQISEQKEIETNILEKYKQFQKIKDLQNQISNMRNEYQSKLKQCTNRYNEQVKQKNEQLFRLIQNIKQLSTTVSENQKQKDLLQKMIEQKDVIIEKLKSNIVSPTKQSFDLSNQRQLSESEIKNKFQKIQNCLKKGLSMKLNSKSSKEEQILSGKSYSSEKVLFKFKRKMQYFIVIYEIYKGMIKYIYEKVIGQKLSNQHKIKQQFEEIYQQLNLQLESLEQKLFTAEIMKESLISQKQSLLTKIKKNENFMKKHSISQQFSLKQPMISQSRIIEKDLQKSQARSLSNSSSKLKVSLVQGHYMMMDNKNTNNNTLDSNQLLLIIQQKDKIINNLQQNYDKLLVQKISNTNAKSRDVVEQIDLPVAEQQSKYVKRHMIRTSSKTKLSEQVINSLNRSRDQSQNNFTDKKLDTSFEILSKLQQSDDKYQVRYSPCKRITQRLSQFEDEDKIDKKLQFNDDYIKQI